MDNLDGNLDKNLSVFSFSVIIKPSMNYKLFLFLILAGTVIAWAMWGAVILNFDPFQTGFLGFAVFYLTLFLGLSGLIFLASTFLKAKLIKKQTPYQRLNVSLRHAVLFVFLLAVWAFLKSQGLLRWWNLLLLILILTTLEFFFISQKKRVSEFNT